MHTAIGMFNAILGHYLTSWRYAGAVPRLWLERGLMTALSRNCIEWDLMRFGFWNWK